MPDLGICEVAEGKCVVEPYSVPFEGRVWFERNDGRHRKEEPTCHSARHACRLDRQVNGEQSARLRADKSLDKIGLVRRAVHPFDQWHPRSRGSAMTSHLGRDVAVHPLR